LEAPSLSSLVTLVHVILRALGLMWFFAGVVQLARYVPAWQQNQRLELLDSSQGCRASSITTSSAK
jgi:hypothetical protein